MKRDWFSIDKLDGLEGVPGVIPKRARWEIHRSHLPLLEYVHPNAPKPLANVDELWAERNRRTEALDFKLRTTQQTALDFIGQRRGVLLGDEMRLGKTLAAAMSHNPARGPAIFVAPLSTRGVWLHWIRRVFPDADIGVAVGKKLDPAILSKPIIFIHYQLLKHWQTLRPFGTVVFDEAHQLTNAKNWQYHAASMLTSRAEMVLAMTGTPIWNMPPDLWALLGLIAPGAWGSAHEFSQRYGAPEPTSHGWKYTGISNGDELSLRLSEVMLRRTWKDAAEDLPPISRSVVIAEISEKESLKLDIIAASLREEKSNTAAHLASYRKATSGIKLRAVVDEANKIIDRGEPLVIWTWHVDLATKIAESMGGFCITGDLSATKRDDLIGKWRETSNGVLVLTLAVGQVGIDLSHAKFAIFAEVDWTPAVIAQAEMRTFHPSRAMAIIFVVLNHIVDQRLVVALERKLSAASPVGVGAATDAINSLSLAIFGAKDEGDISRFLDDLFVDL